jgi:hypothetical protein
MKACHQEKIRTPECGRILSKKKSLLQELDEGLPDFTRISLGRSVASSSEASFMSNDSSLFCDDEDTIPVTPQQDKYKSKLARSSGIRERRSRRLPPFFVQLHDDISSFDDELSDRSPTKDSCHFSEEDTTEMSDVTDTMHSRMSFLREYENQLEGDANEDDDIDSGCESDDLQQSSRSHSGTMIRRPQTPRLRRGQRNSLQAHHRPLGSSSRRSLSSRTRSSRTVQSRRRFAEAAMLSNRDK